MNLLNVLLFNFKQNIKYPSSSTITSLNYYISFLCLFKILMFIFQIV